MKISTYNYIMSSKTVSTSDFVVKPLATAACTFAIDQLVFNESNFNSSTILSVSSAAGAYLGMMVGSSITDLSNSLPVFLGNGKGIIKRVAEIGFGVGTSYGVNKFILKYNTYRENMTNKLITLTAADIAREYISDFVAGRPLSILAFKK